MTTVPETLVATGIAPGFTVNDLAKSIAFYEGLGFTVGERWEHEGVLRGVMLDAGHGKIGINQDDFAKGRDRPKGVGMSTWIQTDQDIDALAERARAAGITFEKEPYDVPWGVGRAFEVRDPDGFKFVISNAE